MTNSASDRVSIDKRDFDDDDDDTNRPLLFRDSDRTRDVESSGGARGRHHILQGERDDDTDGRSILSEVASEIVDRDRVLMKREIIRFTSFIWGLLSAVCAGSITAFSLYGHLLLTRLHYTQFRVNAIAVTAELVMYLTAPLFGYLCDRITPSPVSLLSAVLFAFGYLLAAFTYKSGPPVDAGGDNGWPFGVMVLAFSAVGSATACMYFSAVTTCAKNFAHSKHKGIMLAMPIAAFGLSGMWQSLLVKFFVYHGEDDSAYGENGGVDMKDGDIDVFRYFLFLAGLMAVVGVVGAFTLKVVDEDKLIDEGAEELERSGLLEDSSFFRPRSEVDAAYGTFHADRSGGTAAADDEEQQHAINASTPQAEQGHEVRWEDHVHEEKEKKTWLLNQETKLFIKDKTMWLLAGGFFLVSGPGEAYINNVGTVTNTFTPPSNPPGSPSPAGIPSTHVAIIALTSTVARLLTGTLSDRFAPRPAQPDQALTPTRQTLTLSRLSFLLPAAILFSLGYLLLASPAPLAIPPLFQITTTCIGFGYGAAFSLVPIIISVVWGVENFGTNWSIVAMAQAPGAAVWGVIYSAGYDSSAGEDGQCFGWKCYGFWALGSTLSVWIAVFFWGFAWRRWKQRGVLV